MTFDEWLFPRDPTGEDWDGDIFDHIGRNLRWDSADSGTIMADIAEWRERYRRQNHLSENTVIHVEAPTTVNLDVAPPRSVEFTIKGESEDPLVNVILGGIRSPEEEKPMWIFPALGGDTNTARTHTFRFEPPC